MEQKIQAARVRAVKTLPYFANALFAMPVIESRQVELMSADQDWRLYYNPDTIQEFSPAELSGRIVHLLMHLLRDHAERCKNSDMNPEKFALAADLEINDDLRTDRIIMPEESVFPEDFDFDEGDMAESYYEMLPDQPGQPQSQQGQKQKQAEQQSCKDGSCCNGKEQEHEAKGESKGRKISKEEAERLRKDAARQIKEESKKGRGDIPAGLERWADQQLEAQVNWRKELASRIRNAIKRTSGCMDYSYSRPSRRRMANVVLPSMIGFEPTVSVCIDTSGSMSDKELSQAIAEVGGILKSCGIREGLDVVSADAEVGNVQKVFSKSQIKLTGGGGTDQRIGIEYIAKHRPETDVCIVISDGWSPWDMKKPRDMAVIVVLTDGPVEQFNMPSWMQPIEVKV